VDTSVEVLEVLLSGQHVRRDFCQAGMGLWGGIQTRPEGGIHFHYVAANGLVDLMVRGMLTRSTRHGLTARLGCDSNVGVVFGELIPRSDSSRAGCNEGVVMD